MNKIHDEKKWFWMMDYCRQHRLPPAQSYGWETAEKAWRMKMNLKSCERCGIVFDIARLSKPDIYWSDGSIDITVAVWDGDDWVPAFICPFCNTKQPFNSIGG